MSRTAVLGAMRVRNGIGGRSCIGMGEDRIKASIGGGLQRVGEGAWL